MEVKGLACWASYLINGDASGIDDNEREQCDKWYAEFPGHTVVACSEQYFSWNVSHLCDYQGADCIDYTLIEVK